MWVCIKLAKYADLLKDLRQSFTSTYTFLSGPSFLHQVLLLVMKYATCMLICAYISEKMIWLGCVWYKPKRKRQWRFSNRYFVQMLLADGCFAVWYPYNQRCYNLFLPTWSLNEWVPMLLNHFEIWYNS